ncbi:MAG: hypothetical protein KDK78_03605 [Chlamydiia bacterium]|nr:hypothetical protein [Chlamydiia bacterium]
MPQIPESLPPSLPSNQVPAKPKLVQKRLPPWRRIAAPLTAIIAGIAAATLAGAAIGTAIGFAFGGIGLPIGAACGAFIGFHAALLGRAMGLAVRKRPAELECKWDKKGDLKDYEVQMDGTYHSLSLPYDLIERPGTPLWGSYAIAVGNATNIVSESKILEPNQAAVIKDIEEGAAALFKNKKLPRTLKKIPEADRPRIFAYLLRVISSLQNPAIKCACPPEGSSYFYVTDGLRDEHVLLSEHRGCLRVRYFLPMTRKQSTSEYLILGYATVQLTVDISKKQLLKETHDLQLRAILTRKLRPVRSHDAPDAISDLADTGASPSHLPVGSDSLDIEKDAEANR